MITKMTLRLICILLYFSAVEAFAAEFPVIATIEIGKAPHGIQIEGDRAYIALAGEDAIGVVDLATMKLIDKWPAPMIPLDLIRSGNGWLISSFGGSDVTVLEGEPPAPGQNWDVGKGPSLFAPEQVNNHAYIVSEFADRLTVFDTEKRAITDIYETGDRPYPADVTSDGVLAFIPNKGSSTVTVLDLLNKARAAETRVCKEPTGGALDRDEIHYIVACGGDDKVQWINTASFEVVGELAEGIGPRPFAVTVSDNGRWAFVNNAGGKTVSVIDLAARKVIETVETDVQPIVMRTRGNRLYVANEGNDELGGGATLSIIEIPPSPDKAKGAAKNEVLILGMIHDRHLASERYSTDYLRKLFQVIEPDYVLTEMPPNRFEQAVKSFQATGVIGEDRIARFAEYREALFPLMQTMKFQIIPTAGWNSHMNDYRNKALKQLSENPDRATQWTEYQAALTEMADAIGEREDDPYFINSDAYDAITKKGLRPYDRHFNDDLGTGGWETINRAHYRWIEKALDEHSGEGKRFLITYGAGHKYWFLEKLKERDDIILLDARPFLDKAR